MPILYKIVNQVTGKAYVGWSGKSLDQRWSEHVKSALKNSDNRKFYNAIRKYGVESWTTEVLLTVETKDEAKLKEIELIEQLGTYTHGYNSTRGGDGNNGIIMSEESNLKRSDALKGRAKKYDRMKGKKHSEESKQKISAAHKGMHKPWINFTEEHRVKSARTRRKITKEQYVQIKELRTQGHTQRKIADMVGLSNDMVKKWLSMEWPENG